MLLPKYIIISLDTAQKKWLSSLVISLAFIVLNCYIKSFIKNLMTVKIHWRQVG